MPYMLWNCTVNSRQWPHPPHQHVTLTTVAGAAQHPVSHSSTPAGLLQSYLLFDPLDQLLLQVWLLLLLLPVQNVHDSSWIMSQQ